MKNGPKSIRINLIHSASIRGIIPNKSKLLQPQIYSDWCLGLKQNESDLVGLILGRFSLTRINPKESAVGMISINSDNKIRFGSIQARIASDWFGFIWIDASDWIGLSMIDFLPFFIKQDTKRFWIGSVWFALARIQTSDWIGITLIGSELISTRNFRQGFLNKKYSNPCIITARKFWNVIQSERIGAVSRHSKIFFRTNLKNCLYLF